VALAAVLFAGLFALTTYLWLSARDARRQAETNALEKQKALTALQEKNEALDLIRASLLRQNGWSDERIRNASSDVIARSLAAGEALQALIVPSATVVPPTHSLQIIYYPKVADGSAVNQTIQQYWRLLGYAPSVRPAVNDLPTNVVWFRGNVLADDLKRIALSLMRAGVQLRAIVRLIGSGPESVIIGSEPDFADYRPWSVDEIVQSNQFGGSTSARQSGIVVIERESDARAAQFLTSRGIYNTTIKTGGTTFNGRIATRQMTQAEAEQLRQELEAAGIHCEIQKP
jgi:hypothetical protein